MESLSHKVSQQISLYFRSCSSEVAGQPVTNLSTSEAIQRASNALAVQLSVSPPTCKQGAV